MVGPPSIQELHEYETVYGVRDPDSELDCRPVYYPVTDGLPMSDSQLGGSEMVRITQTLQDWFAPVPDVYVWMNMFVYYEPRNPRASVSPDVFVAIGAAKEPLRKVYFVWREGVPPTVTFEVLSSSTHLEDVERKPEIYARMGVHEYVLYDPHQEFMEPPLQVMRLEAGVYRPVEPDETGAFLSEPLGLLLRLVDGRLRFFDPRTGNMVLSPAERTLAAEQRAEAEARRAAEEAAARRAAEERAAELQAQIAALQARLGREEQE